MNKLLLLFTTILLYSCNTQNIKKKKVDKIVLANTIYIGTETMDKAEAMAIHKGKIVYYGSKDSVLYYYKSNQIDSIDGIVYPGFIDAHCHFWGLAKTLLEVDLTGCKSWAELLDRCKKFDVKNPNSPIVGRGWDESLWENEYPNKKDLDSIFPTKAVYLRRVDGHAGIANSFTLQMAGIDEKTKISGGSVVLGKDKKPSGVLIDNALDLVNKFFKDPAEKEMCGALIEAGKICNAFGLTSIADAGLEPRQIEIIDSLIRDNKIHLRMYAMLSYNPKNLAYAIQKGKIIQDHLRVHSFKFYADGALGSAGAKLKQPYCGSHQYHNGLILSDLVEMKSAFKTLLNIDFQAHTHCIGDSANLFILDLYNKTLANKEDKRWRVEHAQIVDPKDLNKFETNSNIFPSIQPIHATSDMRWAEDRLCSHRMGSAYAYKALLNSSKKVAIGTDFPVKSPNTLENFYAAVARKNKEHLPENGFLPAQKLSREETFLGMTNWAAYTLFMDDIVGSLQIGKMADYIVMDKDILQCNEKEILQSKIIGVYQKGKNILP